jgi:hypothetical protein
MGASGNALIPIAPGDWPAGSRPGKLIIMHATIPTYHLHGIEAIPAHVVGPNDVRVVERGSGRVLATDKHACKEGSQSLGEEDQPRPT